MSVPVNGVSGWHGAQGVYVRGRGSRAATNLFLDWQVGSKDPRLGLASVGRLIQNPGQFWKSRSLKLSSLGLDQNIRGLQIPMNNKVAVRICERVANLEEEFQFAAHIEQFAICVNRHTVDILAELRVQLAAFCMSRIEQAGNSRMTQ